MNIMFNGFPEETVRFFLNLRLHNEHSFFKAHETEYRQNVKEPFYAFIEAMAPAISQISDDMELRPGKCLARIHRDTRFSKDKTPFRDHLWVLFRRSAEPRDTSVMYWFELSPDYVDWGLGFWGANRPAMDAFRRRLEHQPNHVLSILEKCRLPGDGLEIFGDCYQRMKVPEAVPEALHSYYPRKSLYIKKVEAPFRVAYQKQLVELVSQDFLRLKPLYELLRESADEGMAQLDA